MNGKTGKLKAQIYCDYQNKIYGYVMSKIGNSQIAEDITSDVFVKVYEKINQYDEKKASLSTWIYLITRNTLIDYFRTKKDFGELPETLSANSSVEEEVCNNEVLNALSDGLKKIDERERNIIVLHFYSRKSLKEISVMMGISYSYVKVLLYRAYAELRDLLAPVLKK